MARRTRANSFDEYIPNKRVRSHSADATPDLQFEQQDRCAFRSKMTETVLLPTSKTSDLIKFLKELRPLLTNLIKNAIKAQGGVKVYLTIMLSYIKINSNEEVFKAYLTTHMKTFFNTFRANLSEQIEQLLQEIMTRNANFIREKSNLRINEIHRGVLYYCKFSPIAGSCKTKLPEFLSSKKGCFVNVLNKDNRCFGYAIAAALRPAKTNKERYSQYCQYFEELGLNNIQYPVAPEDVPQIEDILKLKINLFSYHDDKGIARYVLYASKKEYEKEIDLLYFKRVCTISIVPFLD